MTALDINTAARSRSSERAPLTAQSVREVQGAQAPRSLQRVYRPELQAVELDAPRAIGRLEGQLQGYFNKTLGDLQAHIAQPSTA